jgi:hypothetical protein
VLRSIALIVAAIRLSRPDLPDETVTRYATALQGSAKQHRFDPLTAVAIIHHESGWDPQRISESGEDYGLAQIRARYVGACRDDADPLHAPSEQCQRVKHELLDPEANIRTMGEVIELNRELCLTKVKSAALHRWLASYQGRNHPEKHRWCQPGKETWEVVRYQQWLIAAVTKKPRRTAATPTVGKSPQIPERSPSSHTPRH